MTGLIFRVGIYHPLLHNLLSLSAISNSLTASCTSSSAGRHRSVSPAISSASIYFHILSVFVVHCNKKTRKFPLFLQHYTILQYSLQLFKVVLYQERQRKFLYKMTSARIKYILFGWTGESLGEKGVIKGGRRNL